VSRNRKLLICFAALLVTLIAAYSNHFENTFHFDDTHTVVDNPAIRQLSNIPRFFGDARAFSADPEHQTYRPLVTVSLAIDYALGHGLDPFWFHVSTFFWFLVQLALMYVLYLFVLERTYPNPQNPLLAVLAVAVYGLHPVSAETVNYVIQRADLYATLGVVAGVVLYAWKPGWRRFGFYLLPALAGMLAKPSALVFAPILLAYIILIDHKLIGYKASTKQLMRSARHSIPAFILSGGFWYFQKVMTPASVIYTKLSPVDYWITQPYVTLLYVRSFFLPLYLKIDTDLQVFHSVNLPALAGIGFCALLVAAAFLTARRLEWRPVSFGLWWFLIGLIPTAVQPLQEVENDHRMFLPFVGLSLAATWTSVLLLRVHSGKPRRALAVAALAILAALSWGTYRRNGVWHTEETLWRDATEKSPNNSRAHYTLALALSKIEGRQAEAISEYRAALRIKPDYTEVHNNLAVALSADPQHLQEAIAEYETALRTSPNSAELHNNFAAALAELPDRQPEAISHYQAALRIKPDFIEAHYNLGTLLAKNPSRLPEALTQLEAVARIKPDYRTVQFDLGDVLARMPDHLPEAVSHYEAALAINPAFAEAHNNLANVLSRIPGRAPEAISHYEAAVRIKPGSMEAHYNLGVLLANTPGRLRDAVTHLELAQRIQPNPTVERLVAQLRARNP
jgi:tetratricopeptide (TPR) repeat protein